MALMIAVDGNSLIHRNYHALAGSGLRTESGEPSWAVKGFWNQLLACVDRVGADHVLVAFDSAKTLRAEEYSQYKAGRAKKDPDLIAQLQSAPGHLAAAGLHVVMVEGYEADDVVASAARRNTDEGAQTVIVTSDRDAFSLINTTTKVLRIINGGVDASPLLDSEKLRTLVGVRPDQYRLYAALRGDTSDNLPGVLGVGPKTAVKLLNGLDERGLNLTQALVEHDAGGNVLVDVVGKTMAAKFNDLAKTNLERNMHMMAQHTELDVGDLSSASLPLDADILDSELQAWGLLSIQAEATRVLTDATPVQVQDEPYDFGPIPDDDFFFAETPSPGRILHVKPPAKPSTEAYQPGLF